MVPGPRATKVTVGPIELAQEELLQGEFNISVLKGQYYAVPHGSVAICIILICAMILLDYPQKCLQSAMLL